jgi:hypothetical protein
MDKVALGQVFSKYFSLPYQVLFHQLLYICYHLSMTLYGLDTNSILEEQKTTSFCKKVIYCLLNIFVSSPNHFLEKIFRCHLKMQSSPPLLFSRFVQYLAVRWSFKDLDLFCDTCSLLFIFGLHLFIFSSHKTFSTYSSISFWTLPLYFYFLAYFKTVPMFIQGPL